MLNDVFAHEDMIPTIMAGIRVATTATDHTIPGLVAAIEHAVVR